MDNTELIDHINWFADHLMIQVYFIKNFLTSHQVLNFKSIANLELKNSDKNRENIVSKVIFHPLHVLLESNFQSNSKLSMINKVWRKRYIIIGNYKGIRLLKRF